MTKKYTIELPIETISEMNKKESWQLKMLRARKQRRDAWAVCRSVDKSPLIIEKTIKVLLIRLSPKQLDDDNLRCALKHVRDGIADWLKIDDGSPLIKWDYEQEKISRTRSVRAVILIEDQPLI